MPNTYQIGRVGRVYGAQESSYGTSGVLAATDAFRHLNLRFNQNIRNRVNSPERHAHPSQIHRFTRRRTADYMVSGILYPSGTINTVSDLDFALEAVFGQKTNVTLSTTVSASPSPTATVFTLASVTGLAANQPILINATNGGRQVRWITGLTGSEVTVAPALSAAPTAGDSVKGCIGYKLATALGSSLYFAHYLTSHSYEMNGCAPENFKLTFDNNGEPMFELSGPAQKRTRNAQADPATFTTAGTTPPSGLSGALRVGSAAEEFLKLSIELRNGIALDNVAFGTSQAQAMYRDGKREVLVNIETMVSNDVTLLDAAENTTDLQALVQCGTTEGSIIALLIPALELDTPDDPNADGTMVHSFRGLAKASSTGNDELYLAVA